MNQKTTKSMEGKDQNDFSTRLDSILAQLKQLGKDYPMMEYNFILSKWTNDGQYETGTHTYDIKDHRNLDNYASQLIALKNTMIERNRFRELLHLPEFRVVCYNDQMDGGVQAAFKKEGYGDWIKKDETYVVWKKRKSITGGWTFFLRDKEGNQLKPPFPYQGWHCSRFDPADYTKEN